MSTEWIAVWDHVKLVQSFMHGSAVLLMHSFYARTSAKWNPFKSLELIEERKKERKKGRKKTCKVKNTKRK